MKWVEDENKRKIVGFISAGVCAVIGATWTVFTFFHNPPDPMIKPHLKVYSQKYIDQKLISIKNNGLGSAVITKSKFCRGSHCTNNIVELFNLDTTWDSYRNLTKGTSIPAGEQYTLLKLSLNINSGKTLEKLQLWQQQKSGITVKVYYKDIEGNKYGPLITTLK